MGGSADEPYFVELGPSLTGRKAGLSAGQKAEELRQEAPWRTRIERLLGRHTDERAWRAGARGEELVGAELRKLSRDRWFVFHDVPIGHHGANVDHLVIGPAGVFVLNAKNLTGKVWVAHRVFMVNGHRTDYLPKAHAEALRAARLLTKALGRPVPVRGVIVVICEELRIKAEPEDVSIVTRRRIRRWMEEEPVILSLSESIEIAGKAHLPTTWTS